MENIEIKVGFSGYNELKEKLEKKGIVDLEYPKKYEDSWETIIIPKKTHGSERIEGVSISDGLAYIDIKEEYIQIERWRYYMKGGEEILIGKESKERKGELYFVLVTNSGKSYKIIIEEEVPSKVSRIHCYIKNHPDKIEIARLGEAPINLLLVGKQEIRYISI